MDISKDTYAQKSRRSFLQRVGGLGVGGLGLTSFAPILNKELDLLLQEKSSRDPEVLAKDESYWYPVQKAYVQSSHFINLESGYFSPQSQEVMEAQLRNIQMINEQPSFYMRRRQFDEKRAVKMKLAQLAGVSPEEIVITRNTTESLNTVILGMKLAPGDEVIMSSQDYGSMLEAFAMRSARYGSRNVIIDLPLIPSSDEDVLDRYEEAITPRTKAIHVTHMINLTGQILPVRKLADLAHKNGLEIIVDAAHSFAHLDYKLPELDCDYYGASLHKWLCAPLGSGILYMKKQNISKLWPLYGDVNMPSDDIAKFEHIGTHPVSTHLTISSAIEFHLAIGAAYKEARLRYLKDYWIDQVKELPNLIVNTPLSKNRSCALANVGVKGMKPSVLASKLYDDFRIFTVAIERDGVQGIRVTPHLYTRLDQLDQLVAALKQLAT
ncbi:MAG: selenocysteine lyase/cysteine desulfurase [Cyclobacteriaceae bacterium]|jgi:selenocysteine lyase/cysteine desulfurase